MSTNFKPSIVTVFVPLFAALIAVSGFIAFPLPGTPVPIVLQNMMPILASGLLGGLYGTASTAIFLAAGLLGLPVFSGGRGGLAHLLGPTGGFLIGYLAVAAFLILFFRKPGVKDLAGFKFIGYLKILAASFSGFALIYVFGIARFMQLTQRGLFEALSLTCLPYLPGDFIKMILVSFLIYKLRPVTAKYFLRES
ncbi:MULTISPECIES: biotin transporter BioY [unclassified Treponema]|uniref:biotin transporter BioY n=1 Tax=unclassified Treponema TaxID=2638727 RepID=UPI0020A25D2A|nr:MULTISPECIES: biotin transporter BioY [unclassified Treponema]UTC68004.1 biotin transporter BioY [Treponema sp. OMZ 789]UTC70726.1 biotin transporter BioY [Treponema sp. OMZ 790]UTC73446.1 biotin transporter BioY [Treponema sp. OMZ 791]